MLAWCFTNVDGFGLAWPCLMPRQGVSISGCVSVSACVCVLKISATKKLLSRVEGLLAHWLGLGVVVMAVVIELCLLTSLPPCSGYLYAALLIVIWFCAMLCWFGAMV